MVMLLKYCYFTSAQQLQILSVISDRVMEKQLQLNKLTCEGTYLGESNMPGVLANSSSLLVLALKRILSDGTTA